MLRNPPSLNRARPLSKARVGVTAAARNLSRYPRSLSPRDVARIVEH